MEITSKNYDAEVNGVKLEWKTTDSSYNSIKQCKFSGNEQADCLVIAVKKYDKAAITKAVEEFARKEEKPRTYNLLFVINNKPYTISMRDIK